MAYLYKFPIPIQRLKCRAFLLLLFDDFFDFFFLTSVSSATSSFSVSWDVTGIFNTITASSSVFFSDFDDLFSFFFFFFFGFLDVASLLLFSSSATICNDYVKLTSVPSARSSARLTFNKLSSLRLCNQAHTTWKMQIILYGKAKKLVQNMLDFYSTKDPCQEKGYVVDLPGWMNWELNGMNSH